MFNTGTAIGIDQPGSCCCCWYKWYKRKLKDWNCTKRSESKISNSVEMWFNAIGSTTNHEDVVITSVHSWYEKAAWPFLTYSLTGRQPYSFPLFHFPSLTPRFPFLLAWLELS